MNRKGTGLIEVSLSMGIFVIAGAAAYYFLYFLPQQAQSNSIQSSVAANPRNLTPQPTIPPPAPPPPPPQAPHTFQVIEQQIGQPFTVDGVQYTVQAAENLGNTLSKYPKNMGMGQSNGGTFVLVKFTANNIGTNEVSLKSTAIFLADSAGRNYRQAVFLDGVSFSVTGYEWLDQQSWQPTSVKPGIAKKLFIIAEAPLTTQGLRIIIANQSDQNYSVPLGL
jgi:uncharacterized protein DUF4352